MKRKVTFQSYGSTRSAEGQLSSTFTDIYSTGAEISQAAASETEIRDREVASETLLLKIPYSSKSLALTTENSVLIGTVRFDITSVDSYSGFRREVRVKCIEHNRR